VTLTDRPLFAFGTLMDSDVMQMVFDVPLSSVQLNAAVLTGYTRRLVRGESFPVLVPTANGKVSGVLIYGLNENHYQRAQFYEGDEYTLCPISVRSLPNSHASMQAGEIDAAFFADNHIYSLAAQDWSIEHWRQYDKAKMLPRLKRYMNYYGEISATEADKHW